MLYFRIEGVFRYGGRENIAVSCHTEKLGADEEIMFATYIAGLKDRVQASTLQDKLQ